MYVFSEVEQAQIKNFRTLIKGLMSEYRYNHSLSVEKEACELAEIYGCNIFKVAIAALLHDIAKDMGRHKQLELIEFGNHIFDEQERNSEGLWHAGAGAIYIMKNLQITDDEIINAVLYHTSGRANMSLLEKIIFVADKVTNDRCSAISAKRRKEVQCNLENVVWDIVRNAVVSLAEDGLYISPMTWGAYNYYGSAVGRDLDSQLA